MEAVVLAGGLGTRLRAVVGDVPKPMAPVAGRPFLEILLGSLARKGVQRTVLSVGYLADRISGHFGESFRGMRLAYAVEREPLGTGGAARLAAESCSGDAFLLLNGDTFLDIELAELDAHRRAHGNPVVVGREVPDVARFGSIAVKHGRLAGFVEKGASGPGLVNAGCYVIDRGMLHSRPVGDPFSLARDLFPSELVRRPVDVFVTRGLFIDIGVPEEYARAQELLRDA